MPTCNTDRKVVTKYLSDMFDKISAVRKAVLNWLPLVTIRGI